jgi:cell division transport system ATP-binding protein
VLRFDAVTKRYPGGQEALSGVTFEVDEGEMVFVTGHSGAGKSTLFKLVALMERPSRGSVLLGGRNLGQARRAQLPFLRRQIGMVFQDHRLLSERSVAENVALPLVIAALPRGERGKRVRAALDLVGLLHKERARPEALSAGEQQRVGIARAIVAAPALLIADEPTGNLDPGLAAEIMALFAALSRNGTTVMVASHDLHLVQRMRKRVLVLEQGRLIDDYRPQAVP